MNLSTPPSRAFRDGTLVRAKARPAPFRVSGIAALALCIAAGCGGSGAADKPTGTVHGKVSADGKPLAQGRVNFLSDKTGAGAAGDIQPDGAYRLEGPVPVGPYQVFITFNIPPSQLNTPAAEIVKSIPQKFQAAKTSGLVADVTSGTIEHNIDLK